MKRFLKWLLIVSVSVALVLPVAHPLYLLLGGGVLGGVVVILLAIATRWAVETIVDDCVEVYHWRRTRQKKTGMVNSKYGNSRQADTHR